MIYRIGIEKGADGGRVIAWALEHPGCFSYGAQGAEVLEAFPAALHAYAAWIEAHGGQHNLDLEQIELQVDETWNVYTIDEHYEPTAGDGYEVDAWFRHDWKPLDAQELARYRELLVWSRESLLNLLEHLNPEQWSFKAEGERWDVAGIVRHVGGAEWWYLDRLGLAFPRKEIPRDPLERLHKVRSRLEEIMPGLEGSLQVLGIDGEFWSPRKLLRRALWHERDHTDHIRKLL